MTPATHVRSSREARDSLGETLARFRLEGAEAEPVLFGSQRRAEAAVIPFALYERLESLLEDQYLGQVAEQRIAGDSSISGDEAARRLGVDPAELTETP